MKLAQLIFVAATFAACGAAPAATPDGVDDVVANLVTRGLTVHRPVSGDPGCPEAGLHDNAVRLYVSAPDETREQLVYIFRWRRMSDYDAASAEYARCTALYQEANPGSRLSTVESAPWRAYGPDWSPIVEQAVGDALRAASGGA